MRILLQWKRSRCIAFAMLLLPAGGVIAQTTGQGVSSIPQQVNQNAQTKAVTKTNSVTNSAMNSLDSASNKAFKGFTGMFKKKNKNKKSKTDSTGIHPTDTVAAPPKTSLLTSPGSSLCFAIPVRQQSQDRSLADDPRRFYRFPMKEKPLFNLSACV
jgi:hypothetical protein